MKKAKKAKKDKQKKKFSFWRMLSYVGCYIFVTFATAFVVVSVNSSTYSFNPPKLNGGSGDASSSLLGNMVSTLMSMSDLEGSLNLTIENGNNVINIDGSLEVVLYDELSGADLKGDLTLNINGNPIDISLLYKENMYLALNGNKMMLDTNSAIEGIIGLLAVSGVDINLDLGSMMGSLDMSVLDTLGQYITEKTLDNGYQLIVDYNGLQAVVGLDSKYGIDYITTPSIVLGGTKIQLDFDITDTNKGTQFDVPENTGVNVTPALRLAKAIVNTVNSETINFDGLFETCNKEITFNGLYNDDNLMLLTNVMGEKIDLYYKDKMAYVDCGFAQLKGNYESVEEIYSIVYDLLPEDIKSNIDNVDIVGADELMAAGFGILTNLNSIDWDIVEHEDYVSIIVDTNEIRFYISGDRIEAIAIDMLDFDAFVNLEYYDNMVVVPALDFIAVSDMASLIRPIYNLAISEELSLDINLIDEKTNESFAGKLAIDFADMRVDFDTNLYSKDIKVNYIDEYIYIKIDDVHVYTHQNNILGLVVYLAQNYNFDFGGIEFLTGSEVLRFENIDDRYFTVEFGKVAFDFEVNDEYISELKTNISGLNVSADIEYNGDVCFDTIDFARYQLLDLSKENLECVYNEVVEYIESEEYNFDFDIKYDNFEVSGYFGYNKGDLAFDISFEVLDRPFRVIYFDEVGYLYIDKAQIRCDQQTILGFVSIVLESLDIDFETLENTNVSLFSVEDIDSILENVNISLDGSIFSLEYNDIFAQVKVGARGIKSIFAKYDLLRVNLYPTFERKIEIPAGEYIVVEDIIDIVEGIKNIVERKYGTIDIDLTYEGINVIGQIKVDLNAGVKVEGNIKALGKDISIYYIDEKIYITYEGVNICTSVGDISTWKEIFANLGLGVLNETEIIEKIQNTKITKDEAIDLLFEVLNSISLVYGDNEYALGVFDHTYKLGFENGEITCIEGEEAGVGFEIGLSHDYPSFTNLNFAEFTYVDLSKNNINSIIDGFVDYLKSQEYCFDINIQCDDFEVNGYVEYNCGDIIFDISFELYNRPFRVIHKENVSFVYINKAQIKCDDATLASLIGLVISNLDIDLSEVENIELQIPTEDEIQSFVDNAYLMLDGNVLSLSYDNVLLLMGLANNSVESFGIVYDGFVLNIDFVSTREIEIPEGEYIVVEDIIDIVEGIKNITERKYGTIDIDLTYEGINVVGQIKVDLNAGVKVEGNIQALGKDIAIYYIDEKIYITYDGVNICTSLENILSWNEKETADSEISDTKTDADANKDVDTSDMIDEIFDIVNSVALAHTNDGFVFDILKHTLNIGYENGEITYLSGNENGLDFRLSLDHAYPEFTQIQFDDFTYLDISKENIQALRDQITDYFEGEKYYFDIALDYEGYEIIGYVEYENGKLSFDISTTLLDNQLNVVLKDDIVYITYANVKVNCKLDDMAKILGGVLKELGIQMPESDNNLKFDLEFSNIDIEDILNEVTLSLINGNLSVKYSDYVINLDLNNTRLNSIVFNGFGVLAKVDIIDKKQIQVPDGTYVNLHNVYDLVQPVQNLIARKYANMTYSVEYGNLEISGLLKVDARETLKASGTANIYGKTIYFDFIENNIYVSVDDLKIYLTLSDLMTLKEYLNLDEKEDITLNDIVRQENNLTISKTSIEDNKDSYDIGFANYNLDLVVRKGEFVSLGFNDFGVCANIQFVDGAPVFGGIDTKNYQYLDLTYDNIESVIDSIETYVNSEEYYFDINAKFGEYDITGWVGCANGEISGYLTATVITKKLEVTLLNGVIYIDFDGLKLQLAIENIDQIKSLLEDEFGVSIPENTESDMGISEYLEKLTISNNNMILNAIYDDLSLYIDFSNYVVNYVKVVYDKADDDMAEISVRLTPGSAKYAAVSGKYLDVASLTNVIKAINKTVSGKTLSGEVDLYITFGGEENILELDYGIRYDESYEMYISTTFKGVKVDIYLFDGTLYIDAAGMKIYAKLSEYADIITWLNDQFDLNIDLEAIKEKAGTSIEDFSFDFLNSWIISNKYIQANIFDNLVIDVYYDTLINKVVFSHGDIKADLYCTSFEEFDLSSVNTTEYSHYTIVTKTIDDIMATIKKKNFDITANAKSYEEGNVDENGNKIATYDVDLNLQISFADILALYGKAIVNDDITVEASWEQIDVNGTLQEYAYVNYDGMKLCANKDSLIEIAAVLLQVLGVDISDIKLFENIGDDFIVETDNFASFLPEMDMGNPLNMLQYIKSLSIEKGVFTLVLKGDLVGQNINDMTAKLYTNNGTIYRLELRDINVGGGETFDLMIDLNTFNGVGITEDKTGFYDISAASQLVKAFVNTSTLRDYHLVGDVNLGLAGIDGLVKVGVDIKVKADENNKTTIAAKLTGFPLVSSITDKNTNHASSILTIIGSSYRTRTINIYIRDGFAYLETDDEEFSSWGSKKDRYIRATKIPVSYLLNNIEYYMQYLMGFADNIQTEINTAIQESKNFTGSTDYSDILKGYKYENLTHTLQLNLEEIAHNTQLGIMEVDIATKSNASTNHKDYLYQLGLDVSFLDLITISTDDNNRLELVDIGQSIDMSAITNYINNYSYNTFGEYIKSGSGAYGQSNSNNVTLTFHQNDGYGDLTVSGSTGSYFTLPKPTCESYIGGDGKEYSFNGWYYYIDTNKTKARLWTESYLPKDSMELFGSWEKQYTLTLYDDETIYNTYKLFEGDIQSLPSIENYFVNVDGVQEYHEFLGWYDGLRKYDEVEMPKKNLTLYSKWDIYNYYTINFVNNGEIYESIFKAENSVIAISELNNYTATVNGKEVVYKWCGWYNGEDRVIGSYVLDGDVILEGRWEEYAVENTKVLKIYDGDTLLYSGNQVCGQEIVMPNNVRIEENTLWYIDKSLTVPYGKLDIMPNEDLTIYICNQFELTIEYSQFRNGRRNIVSETHKVYQNADISSYFPSQISGSYDDGTETKCIYYTFVGWDDTRRIMPNGDITISANWTMDTKYYFTINFDTSNKPDGRDFYVAPTTPESIRWLDGTTLTLTDEKYKPTCQTRRWLFGYTYYNYVADGWSYTSSTSTSGGGQSSIVINSAYAENGVITLYPCWKSK